MHIHTEGACFEGSQTGGVQWWMGCIFCLQTAGLQSGQRGREGHRSTYTLAQVLDLCALVVRVCVHVHPGCYPVSSSDRGFSDGGLGAPFSLPICPGPAFSSLGFLTDRQSCQGDGWLCAWFQCQSLAPLLPCSVGPCQRYPVRSAILSQPPSSFFFVQLFEYATISPLLLLLVGPVQESKKTFKLFSRWYHHFHLNDLADQNLYRKQKWLLVMVKILMGSRHVFPLVKSSFVFRLLWDV